MTAPPLSDSAAPGELAAGALIDGKYVIERVIGRGGMGVVYVARDRAAEVPVVVKAIRSGLEHRKDIVNRILAEGRALAKIDHPNVVRLNAIIVEPGAIYLVMQFIQGEALDARLDRDAAAGRSMPIDEALRLFRQIVAGVGAAHAEGIIHRDLKPSNLLIRASDGQVKVTDFGIAKHEEDAKARRGATQGIIGSPPYMAPEQISGEEAFDKRVDIYALGIVLYRLLTGTHPFQADSTFDMLMQHLSEPMPLASARCPDLPPHIDALIQKACAKHAEERFSSCEELLAALDQGAISRAAAPRPLDVPAPRAGGPIDASGGAARTIAAAPLAIQADARTNPGTAPSAALAPAPAPDPSPTRTPGGTTSQPLVALIEPPPSPPPASRGANVRHVVGAALGIALVAAGALALFARGPSDNSARAASSASSRSAEAVDERPAAPSSGSTLAAAPPALAALAGAWVSDSGRVYDAAVNGASLELQIRDPAQFAGQGYLVGEARFTLTAQGGADGTFAVTDRLRPLPPEGTSYDAARARTSCLIEKTSVNGKPLRAKVVGGALVVELARMSATSANFRSEARSVVGCEGLAAARATVIESVLKRP